MVKFARALLLGLLLTSANALAFQILSPRTTSCHEQMLLGVLGEGTPGFVGNGLPSTQNLLTLFTQRVEQLGIPQDRGTQGMMSEMTKRFHWHRRSPAEIFVLTSFVAGVRNPDTRGFSIVDINQVRSIHVRDDDQDAHTLRQSSDNEPTGNGTALAAITARIYKNFTSAQQDWNTTPIRTQRWTFAFYGEQEVRVFGPAYQLGLIAHNVQDSYAHTMRDDNMRIVSVLNYVDLMIGKHKPGQDGPAHSDRMDQCNADDNSFDSARVDEARVRVAQLYNAAHTILANNSTDISAFEAVINNVYDFRSGCDISNKYCDSPWYHYATSEITKPLLSGCGLIVPTDFSDRGKGSPQASTIFLLLLAPFLFALTLRFSPKALS